MGIQTTIDLLQALHMTIPGVKRAPKTIPGALNSGDLPTVIVWPGRGVAQPVTARAQVRRTLREYSVRVFVEAVGQSDYDKPAKEGIALLERFLETYFDTKTLADGYTELVSIEDSGLVAGSNLVAMAALLYAGNYYKGFVCNLSILELWS